MKVDTTPVVTGGRKSIRITTQASFNGGLLIMDALHMPTGCGTWPYASKDSSSRHIVTDPLVLSGQTVPIGHWKAR